VGGPDRRRGELYVLSSSYRVTSPSATDAREEIIAGTGVSAAAAGVGEQHRMTCHDDGAARPG